MQAQIEFTFRFRTPNEAEIARGDKEVAQGRISPEAVRLPLFVDERDALFLGSISGDLPFCLRQLVAKLPDGIPVCGEDLVAAWPSEVLDPPLVRRRLKQLFFGDAVACGFEIELASLRRDGQTLRCRYESRETK